MRLLSHGRGTAESCGSCARFLDEDTGGIGYCDERGVETRCGEWCKYYERIKNIDKDGDRTD